MAALLDDTNEAAFVVETMTIALPAHRTENSSRSLRTPPRKCRGEGGCASAEWDALQLPFLWSDSGSQRADIRRQAGGGMSSSSVLERLENEVIEIDHAANEAVGCHAEVNS